MSNEKTLDVASISSHTLEPGKPFFVIKLKSAHSFGKFGTLGDLRRLKIVCFLLGSLLTPTGMAQLALAGGWESSSR